MLMLVNNDNTNILGESIKQAFIQDGGFKSTTIFITSKLNISNPFYEACLCFEPFSIQEGKSDIVYWVFTSV